jgi:hypothetical protein
VPETNLSLPQGPRFENSRKWSFSGDSSGGLKRCHSHSCCGEPVVFFSARCGAKQEAERVREKNEKKLIAALYKEESGLISLPVSGLHMTPVVYLKETFFWV